MKKWILILVVGLNIQLGFSQKFMVTKEGLRDSSDLSRSFVVINFPGMTADKLYQNSIIYIQKNYVSPGDVLKGKVDNEYLSFETGSFPMFVFKPSINVAVNGKYLVELNFKDGKIKYEYHINDVWDPVSNLKLCWVGKPSQCLCVWDQNMKIRFPEYKEKLENYFNDKLLRFIVALKTENKDKDNW